MHDPDKTMILPGSLYHRSWFVF